MRYPPTCTSMSTSLSAPATHPVGDVLLGPSPQRSSAASAPRPTAVILDLFGTLVAAPSVVERRAAAAQFAAILRVSPAVAESVLSDSWQARHDGQMASTTEVAVHLVARCDASAACVDELDVLLARLAHVRLQADASLLQALEQLRRGGTRLAVLSDASPDIAEAWSASDLAPHFDAVVFSCRAGAVKPDRLLFRAVLRDLGVAPQQALYCGDGGGDELAGAEWAGMRAVRVERRGGPSGLAFGETAWSGRAIPDVEALPTLLDRWGQQ
ncbi:HAD family hydrolase [Streptomyces bobili]|uniref:HAD family hydrolase n=1 Tax=Streptomyces bobili TaxID=67280 RepID=UPI00224F88CE|nr:HAD family hydrolase [Streptomyces bobili]MCX5525623.1 HAD family hydrolase [Streptomyces bobili]